MRPCATSPLPSLPPLCGGEGETTDTFLQLYNAGIFPPEPCLTRGSFIQQAKAARAFGSQEAEKLAERQAGVCDERFDVFSAGKTPAQFP